MLAYLFQPKRLNLLTKVSYPKNFHTYLIRLIVLSSREMHLQYKLKNLKRTCLKFLKKIPKKQCQVVHSNVNLLKSIKTHHLCLEWGVLSMFLLSFSTKVSYSLVDMSLDTWYLGFFTCFHVSLSQEQECDKNPSTPFSSLDIYVYACLVFRNFLTDFLYFSVQSFLSVAVSLCPTFYKDFI